MVGAFISGVLITAIALTVSPTIALICLIYYIAYQQLESYVIYPRIMARSVEVPGAVTVIAALVGGGLLGVIGAVLAVPVAAACCCSTARCSSSGRTPAEPHPLGPTKESMPRGWPGRGRARRIPSSAVPGLPDLDQDDAGQDQRAPTNCTARGTSPSNSQAKASAKSTSLSATNDASREPSRRPAAMPVV